MESLYIDTNLTYDPNTLLVNQPLKITNKSNNQLVYKIKTNHKNLVSMTINHGFIKVAETISIHVRVVENVQENIIIKLQINWANASQQIKAKNDSKMTTISKQNIYKCSFTILRKIQPEQIQKTISQFKKQNQVQQSSASKFKVFEKVQPFLQDNLYSEEKSKTQIQQCKKQESNQFQKQENSPLKQQKDLFESTIGQTQNLQIVAQEDQQDHEKEIQQVKSQQLQQRRKLDQIKVKVSRLNEEVKAKEIIQFRYLIILISLAFILGNVIQNLIF